MYLPVSIEAARDQLSTRLSGIWTVDGGTRYMRAHPYRDFQQYTGVVNGNSFNLAGPFGYATIPLIIEGELQANGWTSLVQLSVRSPLGAMGRSLVGILVVGAVYLTILHLWVIVPGLLFLATIVYLHLAFTVRRQVNLLIDQRFFA
jgi:hypothetical protein